MTCSQGDWLDLSLYETSIRYNPPSVLAHCVPVLYTNVYIFLFTVGGGGPFGSLVIPYSFHRRIVTRTPTWRITKVSRQKILIIPYQNIGSLCHQKLNHPFDVPLWHAFPQAVNPTSQMKRRVPLPIPQVRIGALLEKQFDEFDRPVPCRAVQRAWVGGTRHLYGRPIF